MTDNISQLANNNNNNNSSMTKEMKEDNSNSTGLLVKETKLTVAENGTRATTEKTKTPQVIVNIICKVLVMVIMLVPGDFQGVG